MNEDLELGDPVSFYNGTETLRFDKENWKWYRVLPPSVLAGPNDDGALELLDGVTSICHIIDKSFYLMPWACKMMAQKILRTTPRYEVPASDDPQCIQSIRVSTFSELVDAAKTTHKEKLEDAGDVGHAAHSWIEDAIRWAITFNKGVVSEMPALAPVDERAVSCGLAAHKWMVAHNVRFLHTERPVYSRKFGYAGTCDGDAVVDSCDDGTCCPTMYQDRLCVIDWKSSNYLYQEYLLQTAAYQNALEEEFPETKYAGRWIIRLGKEDGDVESWFATERDDDFRAFEFCLGLSRQTKKIEHRLRDQKKLRTFRRREAKKAAKPVPVKRKRTGKLEPQLA